MKKSFLIHAAQRLLPALVLPLASLALAQQPHSHGRLALEVAVDPQTITLTMEAPLDNFLGFERAPRTDAPCSFPIPGLNAACRKSRWSPPCLA
jgi:hypothetical protein